jgi:peptide alpha-N-acetyltransferase
MPKGRKGKKTKGKRDAPGPEDDDGPEEAEGPEDSPESAGKPEQEGAKEMSPEAPEQKGGCCAKSSCCGEGSASMPTGMPKQLIAEFVPLDKCGQRHDLKDLPGKYVVYEQYKSETQLPRIMEMMTADLSEPYSIFTYRYFIHQWPDLCLMAILRDDADPSFSRVIGSIVCKLDYHKPKVSPQKCIRGYIAMLAVEKEWRGHGLGSTLARYAIETMTLKNCDEVVLETEITNSGALRLYENLGFVRDKRLQRYYLNGVDAFRLKLWLTPLVV